MTRVAAVIVAVGDEPLLECVESVRHLDEVHVLTTEPGLNELLAQLGARVTLIERPEYIEAITPRLLGASTAEWVLFLDPDERFVCADIRALRSRLALAAASRAAGCWLAYQLSFLTQPLNNTYSGLRKPKLVRPQCVTWPTIIHSVPRPIAGLELFELPVSMASVQSDLLGNVERRLIRHMTWAMVEAQQHNSARVDGRRAAATIAAALRDFSENDSSSADGIAGVLNALLHLQKAITRLLFEAKAGGLTEEADECAAQLGLILAEAGHAMTQVAHGRWPSRQASRGGTGP